MTQAQIIFFDLMPDYTVSVLVKGTQDWDLFKSMNHLTSWCESEFSHFELVCITNTTYQDRINLGVFDE